MAVELLAQLLEELSLLTSDHRRKKPREVPRPFEATGRSSGRTVTTEEGYEIAEDAYDKAFAMMRATMRVVS